jgi:hypothetical protein
MTSRRQFHLRRALDCFASQNIVCVHFFMKLLFGVIDGRHAMHAESKKQFLDKYVLPASFGQCQTANYY